MLRLDLLLLLDYGPDFLSVLVTIRQPQPDLRHMGQELRATELRAMDIA